jgi:mRNA-degrading endonuclease RelE of RelBE toxin-antitoxin system
MFRVVVHPDALAELDGIVPFHRRKIVSAMNEVLTRDPMSTRRSRVKKLRGTFWPPFRLRVGDFRVYHDVDVARREVVVMHVWEKGRAQPPDGSVPGEAPAAHRRRKRRRRDP